MLELIIYFIIVITILVVLFGYFAFVEKILPGGKTDK